MSTRDQRQLFSVTVLGIFIRRGRRIIEYGDVLSVTTEV